MKLKRVCIYGLVIGMWANANAQKSFDEFRKELFENYNSFRSEILSNYSAFLDEIWGEYEQMAGEHRFAAPKPANQPIMPPNMGDETYMPEIKAPQKRPDRGMDSSAPSSCEESEIRTTIKDERTQFDFFGISIDIVASKFNIHKKLYNTKEYGKQWQELEDQDVYKYVVPALKKKANEMGLNGYLTYRLIKDFVDARFTHCDVTSRMAATHYLMLNSGYDARIAVDGKGIPLVLLNCRETLYAKAFTILDGNKYYIFADNEDYEGSQTINTCVLPKGSNMGRKVDFVISKLNIPYQPQEYKIEFEDILLTGEYNKNLYAILYRYPQLPIEDYAISAPDPKLRRQVCEQISAALAGMPRENAIETLLNFTQKGFKYATDEEYHGFEKPYFFEEMVYYDKCDCEDRAIFYSYLLWTVLNVPCHVIQYPEHESVAIKLSENKRGFRYHYNNGYFYISDPTYIGASTGMCMKEFMNETPVIDFEYK